MKRLAKLLIFPLLIALLVSCEIPGIVPPGGNGEVTFCDAYKLTDETYKQVFVSSVINARSSGVSEYSPR